MKNRKRIKRRIINLIMPAVVFGSLTGVITASVVMIYKFCAGKIIHFSESAYGFMRTHLWAVIPALAVIAAAALVYKAVLTKHPNVRGGGIPTSIALMRGIISFRWAVNLVWVFILSLISFFIGVPLGNEGPSVQMGTAVGNGVVDLFAKKQKAYSRYAMTGGACAGFSVATGAPISGMMFAVEEAHHRISPMIIMVSAISVLSAALTASVLSPLLGVNTSLFAFEEALKVLSLKDMWIPLGVGLGLGVFAAAFLKSYEYINRFSKNLFAKVPFYLRICVILAITLGLGILSYDLISTGHELTLGLFEFDKSILLLFGILLVRWFLTLFANTNGITGGIFLPIIALGAVVSSILGNICVKHLGLGQEYYSVILALGICACISGMMKMPLTAVFFGVEALSCYENIIPVIIVSAAAYSITEVLGLSSINDSVIEARNEETFQNSRPVVKDTHVTVAEGSFAVGKQVRDIFWPNNLFVLSVNHGEKGGSRVDEHGENHIHPGDILHVRYASSDVEATESELWAIVGEQNDER
ncbi:MAG: chloride channel protein [Clostridia bacterium]|nr:chloride channel protein [Clostridia bacterium]